MSVFIESLKRLYQNNKIDDAMVIELFNKGKINEEEKSEILDAHSSL